MAVNDISDKKIIDATGKSWVQWREVFKSINAKDLSHREITEKLSKDTDVGGWWIQTLTVKFEQEIGRRKKGQESNGTFTMGVGKVVDGDMDDVFAKWIETIVPGKEYNGQRMQSDPKSTTSEKWRYWRAEFSDSTKAVVGIHQQKVGKVGFAVDQQKCRTEAQAKRWKSYWRKKVEEVFVN